MLKIRLRRMGAIRQPHYRIVVADARSPRDGRFFEILGHYNPRTDPPTIQLDLAKYEDWKRKGAQPTEAVERLIKQYNSGQVADTSQPAAGQTRRASRRGAAPEAAPAPAAEAAPEVAAAPAAEDTTQEPVLEAASTTPAGAPEGATDTDTAS